MIIESSSIQFLSQHSMIERQSVKESLEVRLNIQNDNDENKRAKRNGDSVEISGDSLKSEKTESDEGEELGLTPELRMVKMLLERMTRRKIDIRKLENDVPDESKTKKSRPKPDSQTDRFSIEYNREESHYESENTDFLAKGMIRTSDGKNINFKLKLEMSREFLSKNNVSFSSGKPKDPLVINFDGLSTQLTDTKFAFDIDSDGNADQMSFVVSGSGFLAIDRNGDGKINDGGELFGPRTGDGFKELKSYDSDNNNWIDEKDPIYDKLLVWSRDSGGRDAITGLEERDVGAIYLENEETPFEIKGMQNDSQGILRSSGIYVKESGSVGTIQQVDLIT